MSKAREEGGSSLSPRAREHEAKREECGLGEALADLGRVSSAEKRRSSPPPPPPPTPRPLLGVDACAGRTEVCVSQVWPADSTLQWGGGTDGP